MLVNKEPSPKPASKIFKAGFFGLSDFARSIILTGFPWNLWIYSLSSNVESLQFINILGFFSYNLIFITIFFFPAILFFKNSKKYFILGSLLTLVLSNYFYGSYKINSSEKDLYNNIAKKINFKIVTAGLRLFEFSDPLNVSSRLIRLS